MIDINQNLKIHLIIVISEKVLLHVTRKLWRYFVERV